MPCATHSISQFSALNLKTMLNHMLAIILGSFILEDVALASSLALVAQGKLTLAQAFLACFLGIGIGDLGVYILGRLSHSFTVLSRFKGLSFLHAYLSDEKRRSSLTYWIVFSRAIPGTRTPTYFLAGYSGYSFLRFFGLTIFSVATWVSIAYAGGIPLMMNLSENWFLAVILFFIFLFTVRRLIPILSDKWTRKAFLQSWRKWLSFEFWPPWLFYIPVVAYYALLSLKYMSIKLPLYCNPRIRHGGLIGESKWNLYKYIPEGPYRLATFLIPFSENNIHEIENLLHTQKISYPFILKPDVGQRGYGVRVIHSAEEFKDYMSTAHFDVLVQEFCDWRHEAGIYYYRFINEKRGHLFSITDKFFPYVTGDGKTQLGDLILKDKRARIIANTYFERFQGRLDSVPQLNEKIYISTCGNHCQGAIFLNGEKLKSEALLNTIESIVNNYPDFHVGRFDVRYLSPEQLKNGLDFKIVELNGAGSEATHIWDPKTTLAEAYATLFEQWRIILKNGSLAKKHGLVKTPGSVYEFFKDYLKSFAKNKNLTTSS